MMAARFSRAVSQSLDLVSSGARRASKPLIMYCVLTLSRRYSFPEQPRQQYDGLRRRGSRWDRPLRVMNQRKERFRVPSLVSIWVSVLSIIERLFLSLSTSRCRASMHVLSRSSLGTTNSAVAIMEGKVPRIIENSEGKLHRVLSTMAKSSNTLNRCPNHTVSRCLCPRWRATCRCRC
jgi:hypothetical protein